MSLKQRAQQFIYDIFDPLVGAVRKIGLTPNNITTIGFFINLSAGFYLVSPILFDEEVKVQRLTIFGIIILFSGLMDVLDGRMARIFKMQSTYGAFYDSVIDRYSELIMFMGLIAYFIVKDNWYLILIVFAGLCGSLMVSYTRARAEGLNIDCSVGILQRPERIILITFSCIIAGIVQYEYSDPILYVGLGIVAIFSNFTAFQRMTHVKQMTEELTKHS
jgi:CDP-diacylglycerol--glycerol-3-phosphate 3-phosphatidyltransferase